MYLTDEEQMLLDGRSGPGARRSMELLLRLGESFDAPKMVPIAYGHISYDFCPEDFWNEMTEEVAPTVHRVTTHPSYSPEAWEKWGLSRAAEWKGAHSRKLARYLELGWLRTETCAEYLLGIYPRQGDYVSMGGSCMQVANNSLFGARVDRMGILVSLAAAVCGRTPYMGLLVPKNRLASHLVELEGLDVSSWTMTDFHCLGYAVGDKIPGFKPVAVNGLPPNLSFDHARALVISMPTSGAVTLAHIVGTTPEAPTLEAATGGKPPEDRIRIGKREMKEYWERLNVWDDDIVEHVAFGCPHATIDEIGRIAALIEGKIAKTSLLIGASAPVEALARRQGWADAIERAGGCFSPVCPSITNPFTRADIAGDAQAKSAATNSARSAHYIASVCGVKVFFGTEKECVDAAVTGKWKGRMPAWK
ncbi:MAG: aconitase X catalytic domain-containing protein [Desulfobacterales bacterium]|nr:aconitase X catalytic domain-containing protein [Desulfobacterales bacterium]